jgi:restriction system protein
VGRSFIVAVARAARAADRAHRRSVREREQAARAAQRAHVQSVRAAERELRIAEKEAEQAYRQSRQTEAEELTAEAARQVELLQNILTARPRAAAVNASATLDPDAACRRAFVGLRQTYTPTPILVEAAVGRAPPAPDPDQFRTAVPAPSLLGKLFGGQAKYERAVAEARARDAARLGAAEADYRAAHAAWEEAARRARDSHAAAEARREREVLEHNAGVDTWEEGVRTHQPEAVVQYLSHVLDSSEYPEEFDERYRAAYSPESKALVVEYVLPDPDVVPPVKEYAYVRSKDEIREKARPKGETAAIYRGAVAALTLRTIRELFAAAPADVLDVVTLNGVVETVSQATGEAIRPCVVSVRTTRAAFGAINLARVEPAACLAALGATVSKKPEELSAVRPVIEFDMADHRFVAGSDVLGGLEGLDERPNVMDLSPSEFEALVTNLFARMGLDAKLTRSSRDGGVDCVAFDPRPVLGGKVVIQAKRYRNTVGVSAVRDLYGTMLNEGANKGILVTTAGYGPDAFTFAKDKPIELIDGGNLLYLLAQHGVEARIVMPDA